MAAAPRIGWPFVVVATLLVTCLLTLVSMGAPGAPRFAILHDRQTITWLTWLLLAPGIIVAGRRFPFGATTPMRWLGGHVAIGVAFSLLSGGLAAVVRVLMGHRDDGVAAAPLISTVAGGLLVYGLVTVGYQAIAAHRVARDREALAERLRADLAEARLTTLEGQLHPHFLFNALNSIAALVRVDPPQAETMLEQLSELLRATLRTNPMREVSLDEALHLTEQYLAIEQVRFQDRLRTTVEATGAARQGRVPQLILQPLVENAVRHGIAPLEAGGSVKVTARVDQDTLVMTVEDDGVGFGNSPPERAGSGLGLKSVRSLLAHLYGADQRFEVGPRTPTGTTVTIAMPYRPVVA